MTKANHKQTVTPASLSGATLPGSDCAHFLPLSARAITEGQETEAKGKQRKGAGLALMIAGFSYIDDEGQGVFNREWEFDLKGSDDSDVHDNVKQIGFVEFFPEDRTNSGWAHNTDGGVSRIAQTAYKTAFLSTFFNMPQPNAAVWTMASKAVPIARAVIEEGMTASLDNGNLKLEGGKTDRAKAMREASTLSKLVKACNGIPSTGKGDSKGAKGKGASGGDGSSSPELVPASPSEITREALKLVQGAIKNEVALDNAALSNLRALVDAYLAAEETFRAD